MACLWHDWVRAPRVHVLIFSRDRFRARCIGRVRLAALALPSGLNFGEGKSRISATMQNFSRQDEALRSGEQPRGLNILDPLWSVASVRKSPEPGASRSSSLSLNSSVGNANYLLLKK